MLPAIMPSAILPQATGAAGLLPALTAGHTNFADPSSAVPAVKPTTPHAAAVPASVAVLLTTALPALAQNSSTPNPLPLKILALPSPALAPAATVAGVTRPATVQPQAAQSATAGPAEPKPDKPPAPAPTPAVAGASAAASTVADPLASGPAAPPPAPTVAVAPSTPISQHSPATQQAAVVVSQLAAQAGSQRVVVQLHPLDLGRIEVSIERIAGGGTHVTLRAERPETLQALQRDQAEIGRALDRAGVPAEQRTVTLAAAETSPATPLAAVAPAIDAAPQPPALGFGMGQGSGPGGWAQDKAQHRSNRPDAAPWAATRTSAPARSGDDPPVRQPTRNFDITA